MILNNRKFPTSTTTPPEQHFHVKHVYYLPATPTTQTLYYRCVNTEI